ncbi:MAG: hypothetical protein V1928_01245 [Parcubacteria group bacterium]
MPHFWIKFCLFCLSVIFFIGGIVFILNYHADNLIVAAPANAEAYFHGDPRLIAKLPDKQAGFVYDWLVAKSALKRDQWQNALQAVKHEVAVFTLNRQAFGLIKNNKQNRKTLFINNISYSEYRGYAYFPALNVDGLDFSGDNWIKRSRKKINSADIDVVLKNLASLNIPASAGSTEPVAALAYLSKHGIKINVFGQVGAINVSSFKPNIANIPNNASLYFQGLEPSAISQKAPYSLKNFNFLMLKSLSGPVEYLSAGSGFLIYALKENNELADIKSSILNVLANIAPRQIAKILPDSTKSIQLIADPSAWKFNDSTENNIQISSIKEPKAQIDLKISAIDKFYVIANNINNINAAANLKTNDLFGNCSKFSKKNLIFINPSAFRLDKYLNSIIIKNINSDKIFICLH